ncbi:hypothetical protein ACLKA6_005917 [Drosophila palustris]
MKLYKLNTHTRGCNKSYDADLVLNPQDHPTAKVGDVVEIYAPEDENGTHLLLQITELNEQSKTGRNVISIESCIATAFKMRSYSNVVMQIVNPADVALDSIEITFKDQYMGRSEMWRLKTYLTNTCVYVNKKIDYNDMQIRCQVYEMWSQGERVASGVITDDTKIVFRSSTSMVYLFLQMSSEMWDFDIHGDLYFEKAVNGFLTELFQKWKKLGCNHEVTIVLFSRTFYAAKSLDEFPAHMRDCLQQDYKGRFYEDFYRVAIQNERNDDWCTVLAQLRKLFTSYQETVLRYHEREHMRIPQATNSTATQGNFLEVLNISLNTFEKHYLDRTFDRTGQLSVVITPGVGVFSVDRELTNITKQRIIDNGVGSDLVCVGEQPLHAVPLLKFHNKDTTLTSADDYSLPHWINLSFYSTNKKIAYSNFIPRIKLPILTSVDEADVEENERNFLSCNQSEYIHNSLFDYDAYDEQIFQPLPAQSTCSLQRVVRAKKTSVPSFETYAYRNNDWENLTPTKIPSLRRKMSDPDIHHATSGMLAGLTDSTNLSESLASEKNARRAIVSIAPIVRPGRALINPFDPSHVTIKLTSNRRRWTHIFPKGPTGVLIQQHHYQAVPAKTTLAASYHRQLQQSNTAGDQYDQVSTHSLMSLSKSIASQNFIMGEEKSDFFKRRTNSLLTATAAAANVPNLTATQAKSYLWGATGEQEWTPAITTVVATAGWPTDLVQLLDRIGRVYKVEAISIMHSAGATTPGLLDALYHALSVNESNYFRWLPKITSTEQQAEPFNTVTDESTLFVILARHSRDPVIKMQTERARGRRCCLSLFLLKQDESRSSLRPFFEYLWLKGFRAALIMVAQRRLYHMDPYPTLRALQLSPNHDDRSLFPLPYRLNFKGYKLRVPVQVDVPATFWYRQQGKLQLDGFGGTLITELMRHLNVCLELYPLYINDSNNMNMQALVQLIAEDRAELSPHQFLTLQRSTKVDYSYPYRVVERCFMLPLGDPIPRGFYIFLPFKLQLWFCLLLQVTLTILLHRLARFVIPCESGMRLWSLLGVPGSRSARVPESRCWLRFTYAILLCSLFVFSASIIVQFYATKLTALLAVTLTVKPSVTLLELFQLPYPIMVLPSDADIIVDAFGYEEQFLRQFSYVNASAFYEHRSVMSASFIYPISTTRWIFLSQQQRYLRLKRFWLSQLCYGPFPNQFQLRIESHFKRPLHHFELHTNEAGLNDHWRSVIYRRALQFGFIHDFASVEYFERIHEVRPMNLNLLASVFYLYLFGVLVSLGAFLGEIVSQIVL